MIKLGPDQNNILMSGIEQNQGYALISPWGAGKSMLLESELRQVVETHMESEEPVNIYLVVYEQKATDLLQYYKNLVKHLKKTELIKIQVLNLKEICRTFSITQENR